MLGYCPAMETTVILIQCNQVVLVTQAPVDSQNPVIKSDCLTCSDFRSQPVLY